MAHFNHSYQSQAYSWENSALPVPVKAQPKYCTSLCFVLFPWQHQLLGFEVNWAQGQSHLRQPNRKCTDGAIVSFNGLAIEQALSCIDWSNFRSAITYTVNPQKAHITLKRQCSLFLWPSYYPDKKTTFSFYSSWVTSKKKQSSCGTVIAAHEDEDSIVDWSALRTICWLPTT